MFLLLLRFTSAWFPKLPHTSVSTLRGQQVVSVVTAAAAAAAAARQHHRLLSSISELPATEETVAQLKADLIQACTSSSSSSSINPDDIRQRVQTLLDTAERAGIGQASSTSGYLSGEWELLYASEDDTRSSPFFWAFRKALDEQKADQIYAITDAIPAPLKEIGPAIQSIDWNDTTQTGRFVSKVKVATLGGAATSIMTTRAAMVGVDGLDGVRLKIETTKPEKSTVLSLLGPVGEVINENAPAFPSGDALEQIRPGSSEVVMRTSFCDEGLRISRSDDRPNDILVWKRKQFANYEFL